MPDNNPDATEVKKPQKKRKHQKNSYYKYDVKKAAKLFSEQVSNGAVTDGSSMNSATRKNPLRVTSQRVVDKENPSRWYVKFTVITPASNINRPMEPIFNVAFNDNATLGVPKFVDVDVQWTGYAETFMMDQVTYNAMQNIRLALKSNLPYTQNHVKACLVNGIALALAGKQFERDVHWNLYDAGDDFNFIKMYRLRNTSVGGYGRVPLYPANYLLDENLPHTNTIYDKVVSIYNNVLRLPESISEFIAHYFGSLFTLDKDGHNDQYLRLIMHSMDWYEDKEAEVLGSIDVSTLSLDAYMDLLNRYSKDFAVVLADLRKCLAIKRIGLQKYNSYVYAFVFDKTIHQALINGYTSDSLIKNGYIRMDEMPGVTDKLTQFLFMGAIQPSDNSPSNVHAIEILDMVLKVNSDGNLKWPSSLDQVPVQGNESEASFSADEAFGLSIVTDITADNSVSIGVTTAGAETSVPVPNQPLMTAAGTNINNLTFEVGVSAGIYPGRGDVGWKYSDIMSFYDYCYLAGRFYLGCVVGNTANNYKYGSFYFMTASKKYTDITSVGGREAFTRLITIDIGTDDFDKLNLIDNTLRNLNNPEIWFTALDAQNQTEETWCSALLSGLITQLHIADTHVDSTHTRTAVLPSKDQFGVTFRATQGTTSVWFSIPDDASFIIRDAETLPDGEVSLSANFAPAPTGLMSIRSAQVNITTVNATVSASVSGGLEALLMYVCQVVDYHIPIAYRRRDNFRMDFGSQTLAITAHESLPVLVKEDYIPYYYNVLDLIPVLYEMFVSLFSIDAIKR